MIRINVDGSPGGKGLFQVLGLFRHNVGFTACLRGRLILWRRSDPGTFFIVVYRWRVRVRWLSSALVCHWLEVVSTILRAPTLINFSFIELIQRLIQLTHRFSDMLIKRILKAHLLIKWILIILILRRPILHILFKLFICLLSSLSYLSSLDSCIMLKKTGSTFSLWFLFR